jgi:hypothetical protein
MKCHKVHKIVNFNVFQVSNYFWFVGETWLKRQYDTMLAQQAYLAAQHGHFTLKLLLPLTLSQ